MKKLVYILLAFHISLFTFDVNSQPSITWQRLYDNPYNEKNYCFRINVIDSASFYLTGITRIQGINDYGTQIIKIDKFGNVLIDKIFDTIQQIKWASVTTSDYGCILVGNGPERFKVNPNAEIVWYKSDGYSFKTCLQIIKTADGGYLTCGYADDQNGYAQKIDSLGNLVWEKFHQSTESVLLIKDAIEISNGNFFLFGDDFNASTLWKKGVLIKTDNSGNEIWRKFYTPNSGSSVRGNNIIAYNGFYILGGQVDLGSYIMKIDANGDTLGVKYFPYPFGTYSYEAETGLKLYKQNEFIFFRNPIYGSNSTYADLFIFDSNFNIINENKIVAPGWLRLQSVVVASNMDILFSGYSDYYDNSNIDFYCARTDSNLYSVPIFVSQLSSETPKYFGLVKNYPNPFNPITNIKFEVSKEEYIEISIYNSLGEMRKSLISKSFKPGIYELQWNASAYPSGIYFCVLKSYKYINSIKLVLLK